MNARTVFSFLLFFVFFLSQAQKDSCWQVMLVKKGHKPELKPDMTLVNNSGFYLYKNCVYEIDLKDKRHMNGRLVDIKEDTLCFSEYFNLNVAQKYKAKQKIICVHYKNLDKLKLIADRALGMYMKYSFDNYTFIFSKDTSDHFFNSHWVKMFSNDTTKYEVVAHMTAQGINALFEDEGKTYYYQGPGGEKPEKINKARDTIYRTKNVIWYTPNSVEQINGIAIGIWPDNGKNVELGERDSLKINGLNLEINPFMLFILMRAPFTNYYADSIDYYNDHLKNKHAAKINGMNVSMIGTIGSIKISGINVGGINTVVDEINGFSISGANTAAYVTRGVCISAVRNKATLAKGVQVALFNTATELRGFQFGLWNKNGRRSLPFVNWQFKPKKVHTS